MNTKTMNRMAAMVMAAAMLAGAQQAGAQKEMNIQKSHIHLSSRYMSPEALWAMGRIGAADASPDGRKIAYQVGYYSVKANKSHQVIHVMDAGGANDVLLTTDAASETDPCWIDGGKRLAFLKGGDIWAVNSDGTGRVQLSHTGGKVEGFKFSPDGSRYLSMTSSRRIPTTSLWQADGWSPT